MINIHSVNGYMSLLTWRLGNLLQLATQGFCKRFVDYKVDPCGRLRDQMEMAARTVPANIAEGSSRHQTSCETEMRLLDVARASVSELEGDYMNWLMRNGHTMWHTNDSRYVEVRNFSFRMPPIFLRTIWQKSAHTSLPNTLAFPHCSEQTTPYTLHASSLCSANESSSCLPLKSTSVW